MLIPADRFSSLPEGCPVRYGDRETTIAGMEVLYVDLSTPAAVRAFAPILLADMSRTAHPPGAVWHKGAAAYVLVGHVQGGGWEQDRPGDQFVSGPTPEACLLAGMKAALDAAKDAR